MNQTRYPALDQDALTPRQREVYDRIVSGPRGKVVGPLRVWLHSPELADHAQALGEFVRYSTDLPPILSELAILVTARIWSSTFEWSHHAPIAAEAGLPEAVIAAIGRGKRPVFDDAKQQAVFNAAVELHRDRDISDATYNLALQALGQRALVDLVGICGYYTLISMTINAFDVPDDGEYKLPELNIPPERMFQK